MAKRPVSLIITEIVLIFLAAIFIFPLILIFYNSFKSFGEILTDVLTLPQTWTFENFEKAWEYMNYPRAFLNTLILTVGGTAGIVLISSMAAYMLARRNTRYSWIILTLCITPLMIPFQTIMVTLVQFAKMLHLTGSLQGLILIDWGCGAPFVIYLYHGFVKTIPKELDECASIDGCSTFRTFFQIIFPLLKPVTSTAIVLQVMWLWNDFLLPLFMINKVSALRNLQLASFNFFGQYMNKWNLALAGLVMSIIPVIIVFIFMQKYIVKGVTAGAVKG